MYIIDIFENNLSCPNRCIWMSYVYNEYYGSMQL